MTSNSRTVSERVWVRDNCELGRINPIDIERATGILIIHDGCEPPCPRKAAAQAWIDRQEQP